MKPVNKDRLEKFVETNRQNFDSEQPSNKVWNGIAHYLELSKSSNNTHWMWKAASIVFFITSCYLLVGNLNNDSKTEKVAVTTIDDEFKATEDYYVSLISEKRDQIYDFSNKEIEVEGLYEVDVEQLDAMYEVLKTQYLENPSKKLQEAMTLNLIVRINLLNQQLSEIEGVKKEKENNLAVEV